MFVAGIDAHSTYLVVTIVNNTGELVHKAQRIKNSDSAELLALLEQYRPIEAVVETCPAWPWLFDLLTPHGFGFVLAHAKELKAISGQNYKRDDMDAELLARIRVAGLIPEVQPKPPALREQATLLRHRATLVRLRTAAASRIHAQLHQVGLRMNRGRLLTQSGRHWVRSTAWPQLRAEQRVLVQTHWDLIDHLDPQIRDLDKRIQRMGAGLPEVALLETIPGIGPYRALLVATEVMPIQRFPSPAHLVSYAGLAPRSSQSGLKPIRRGSIPRGSNRWLRGALVRAIVSHVANAPDSRLSQRYTEDKKRLGWPIARIAAARRLARAIHAMLRTGEVWRDQPHVPGERGELLSRTVA